MLLPPHHNLTDVGYRGYQIRRDATPDLLQKASIGALNSGRYAG